MDTLDDLSVLREPPFVDALTKFEELMTQNDRAFLLGAGCSKCAGLPLTQELTDEVLKSPCLDNTAKEILGGVKAQFSGAKDANIEDYLSEIIDLHAIAQRRCDREAKNRSIDLPGSNYDANQLLDATKKIKRAIVAVIERKVSIDTHWQFVKAIHRPIRPGMKLPSRPVDYIVLNYDTLIEDALALEKMPFADGLEGGATGWWNLATFKQDSLAARVFKLHGSINWCEILGDPLPRRVPKELNIPLVEDINTLIWPASIKYRETQRDPYAQLTSLVREILRPKNRAQETLVACGYRFGESHINLEIDGALRESEGRLTVVAFSSQDQPTGQLKKWLDDPMVSEQVLIFAKHGFFHGDTKRTSSVELPWWKFENLTRLMRGER